MLKISLKSIVLVAVSVRERLVIIGIVRSPRNLRAIFVEATDWQLAASD